MLAQSTSRNLRIASITACGFCAVAALSRYTSGLPCMVCLRTGKSSRIRSTSKPAAISVVTVLMEFLGQNLFQLVPQLRYLDPVDDVLLEGLCQQASRLLFADAARLQVEQRFRVQLANRRAMRAAHIVGEDLQLGLGVDHRIVG